MAGTGLTEYAAKAAGFDYEKVFVFPMSHASYYPNACEISMKVIFTKDTGRILGAQLFGKDGGGQTVRCVGDRHSRQYDHV